MTGISNSFKSFNFGNLMIRNLQYDVCIRPEAGYCRFQLMESSSSTDSFKIDPASTTTTSKVKLSFFSHLLVALQEFWTEELQNFSNPYYSKNSIFERFWFPLKTFLNQISFLFWIMNNCKLHFGDQEFFLKSNFFLI